MVAVLPAVGAIVLLYLTASAYRLIRNVIAAKQINLPVLVYPVDPSNPLWILASVPLRPWLRRHLPTRIWNRLTLAIYGSEFYEKRRPFDEYAAPHGGHKSFLVASSGGLELRTADPAIAVEVLRRTHDFEMPALTGMFLGQFGHNVLTTNGDKWSKQRKVVTGVINERISKSVFDATITQTTGMLEELLDNGTEKNIKSAESNKLFDMIKKITIHVLSEAGMGADAPWRDKEADKPRAGFKMTYIEACKVVMESVTGALILPATLLLNWPSCFPGYRHMRQLGVGKTEFPIHTKTLLDQERRRVVEGETERGGANIMSQLLQASADHILTEEELNGNLFLFTAAGFETTANTLSYALVLLARYPEWQEWLFEEVDDLMPMNDAEAPNYTAVFPQLTRILAVMFETLRLYTPVVHVIRSNPAPQEISTQKGTIRLPADSSIVIDNIALHLDPDAWRDINHESDPPFVSADSRGLPDESAFRPSRWINHEDAQDALYRPPRGFFIPWGHGPRVCPGQKMGQVEFSAVMLKLLQRHRLNVVPLAGEKPSEVNSRLDSILNNSIPKMTLIMEGIYDVGQEGGLRMRITKRK